MQVANKKQRDTAASDAEMLKKKQASEAAGNKENQDSAPADILGEQDDNDIIF